jgi:hypothetical protein
MDIRALALGTWVPLDQVGPSMKLLAFYPFLLLNALFIRVSLAMSARDPSATRPQASKE